MTRVLIGTAEVARRLHVHPNTVRNWANDGTLTVAWQAPGNGRGRQGNRKFDPDVVERLRQLLMGEVL